MTDEEVLDYCRQWEQRLLGEGDDRGLAPDGLRERVDEVLGEVYVRTRGGERVLCAVEHGEGMDWTVMPMKVMSVRELAGIEGPGIPDDANIDIALKGFSDVYF